MKQTVKAEVLAVTTDHCLYFCDAIASLPFANYGSEFRQRATAGVDPDQKKIYA